MVTMTEMDQMLDVFVGQIVETIESANKIAERVKAATEGVDSQVEEFIENSEDPQIVQFREWREQISQQIADMQAQIKDNTERAEELAKSQVADELDFDVDEAKAEYLRLRSEINNKRKGLGQFFNAEKIEAALSDTPELIGFRGTRRGGGTPRPRLSAMSINSGAVEKPTFSEAAKILAESDVKVTAGELIAAALDAAGTKEWQSLEGEQSFTYEGHEIVWTPDAA